MYRMSAYSLGRIKKMALLMLLALAACAGDHASVGASNEASTVDASISDGDNANSSDTDSTTDMRDSDADGSGDEPQALELVIDQPLVLCGYPYGVSGGPGFSPSIEASRRLTIMPGRYSLPEPVVATPDDYWPPLSDPGIQEPTDVPLQMTLEDRTGSVAFSVEEPIRAETVLGTYSVLEFNEQRLNVGLRGTLRLPNGELWEIRVRLDHEIYRPNLSEVHVKGGDIEHARGRSLSLHCEPEDTDSGVCNGSLYPMPVTTVFTFYDCDFPWSSIFEWSIQYPEGSVTFLVQRTVPRHPETNDWYPVIVVGAHGKHGGVEWVQDDPLHTTTVPNLLAHDPIVPPFAVRFPDPIDGACGLSTHVGSRMVDDGSYTGVPEVQAFDCEHQRLDAWEADSVEMNEQERPN